MSAAYRTSRVLVAVALALVLATPASAAPTPATEPVAAEPAAGPPPGGEPPPAGPATEEAPPASDEPAEGDRAEAAAAFLEGSKYYELGQYPRAVEAFERAWELSHEPLLLFNLGQAHRKWYDVEPDIEHLRRARVAFENYDKRMAGSPGYDAKEIAGFLKELDAQISDAELNRETKEERAARAREEAERRRLELERQRREIRALHGSGISLLTLGSLTFAMGIAGMLTRVANRVVLDQASGGPRAINLSSAAEDAKRRNAFLVGGQIAYSGFIIGGVLLPAGIALEVVARVRERRTFGGPAKRRADVALGVDGTLTVRF